MFASLFQGDTQVCIVEKYAFANQDYNSWQFTDLAIFGVAILPLAEFEPIV